MKEQDTHLRDYLNILFKRRNTILAVFAIVFSVVLIFTFAMTPIYTATTSLLIEKNMTPVMSNYYFQYDPEFFETQYQIIKSDAVAERVVRILSLDSGKYDSLLKIRKNPSPDGQKPAGDGTDGKESLKRRQMANIVLGGLKVSPVTNTKIVNVSYSSPNPGFSSAIANTVAQAYIEEILDMKMSSTRNKIQWMSKKAEEELSKLKNSELTLQQYVREQEFVTLENKVAIIPEKLNDINAQLMQSENRRKDLETLYEKVKNLSGDMDNAESIQTIASDSTLQSVNTQILKSEQNIAELSKKYRINHPLMAKAKEEMDALKAKRKKEIERIIESVRNQYDMAKSQEDNLRKSLAGAKREALNINEKFAQHNILKREIDTNQQLYGTIMKWIKEQNITEETQTVEVWVIKPARVPSSPSKPNKMLNILVGLFSGLFGGVAFAFFVDYLDNSIKNPDEAEKKLGKPVLGMVSLYKPPAGDPESSILDNPALPFSEHFKAIRSSILLSAAKHPPRKILITSMLPEEGKTFISVNLAIAFAQANYSVLIIDADLRKPRIHKIFELDNKNGLCTYLAGVSDIKINDSYQHQVQNLSIMSAGPVPPNPSELLGSERMSELLNTLSGKYDMIICDSPPVLSVTDGLILSKIVDGTIVVTHTNKSSYDLARRGIKYLDDIKAHMLGIVINAFDIRKSNYYYYSKSYPYYYYSDEKPK